MLHITGIIVVEGEEIEKIVEVSVSENVLLILHQAKRPEQKHLQEKRESSLKLAKI